MGMDEQHSEREGAMTDLSGRLAGLRPAQRARLLAALQQQGQGQRPIRRASRAAPLPLSFAQERLWFLDQLEPGNPAYIIPLLLRMTGRLDTPALERSLNAIVRRHESLRTTFVGAATRRRRSSPGVDPGPALSRPAGGAAPDGSGPTADRRRGARPFDLARGPLIARPAVAPGRHGTHATADHAPHRRRWLVYGRASGGS